MCKPKSNKRATPTKEINQNKKGNVCLINTDLNISFGMIKYRKELSHHL